MNKTAAVKDGAVNTGKSDTERIGLLEERSKHAATTAQLYKALLSTPVATIALLGGLMFNLHYQQVTLIQSLVRN